MLLAVRISSYGCTWEVWRALKKLELLSATPRATLPLLSCSPNFPRASITRYTHAKHEPILKINFFQIFENTQEEVEKIGQIFQVVICFHPSHPQEIWQILDYVYYTCMVIVNNTKPLNSSVDTNMFLQLKGTVKIDQT